MRKPSRNSKEEETIRLGQKLDVLIKLDLSKGDNQFVLSLHEFFIQKGFLSKKQSDCVNALLLKYKDKIGEKKFAELMPAVERQRNRIIELDRKYNDKSYLRN
jgi:hypothetical protein